MAGIGFVLRKLSRQDNLIGIFRAYLYSALISTGPWLFTILTLGAISILSARVTTFSEIHIFRQVIIYNFSFSLVFSSPIFMVVTRFLADSIYSKDVSGTPGLMLGSLLFTWAVETPIVCWFYLIHANLEPGAALNGITNFYLISAVWVLITFVTAVKNYRSVITAFTIGLLFSLLGSIFLAVNFGAAGILFGFNFGLAVLLGLLIARIFAEYPYSFKEPFRFLKYFKKYWKVALSGFVYNVAAWVDKWIMWFAPEGERTEANFLLYTNYDSAIFLAYLTVIPAMALFMLTVETDFYEKYLQFYSALQKNATLRQIITNHKAMIDSIVKSSRSVLILQGVICVLIILISPEIFRIMEINYLQLGIFRFGVLGSLFQALTLFLSIFFSYFDNQTANLKIQGLFLITNALFTIITLQLGFRYYGYGYFMATLVTFLYATVALITYVKDLVYHTFITNNTSVS